MLAVLEQGVLETAFRVRDPCTGYWELEGYARVKIIPELLFPTYMYLLLLRLCFGLVSEVEYGTERSMIWSSSCYRGTFLLAGILNNEPKPSMCPAWCHGYLMEKHRFSTSRWKYFRELNCQQSKHEFGKRSDLKWGFDLVSREVPIFIQVWLFEV